MNENEARQIAEELYAKDELFIMLSSKKANMIKGISEPYIGQLPNGNGILFVFTSYEQAKEYIDKCGYEVLDGVYTIARIDSSDSYRNLYAIFNSALSLGVENVDFNPMSEDAFGCKIRWFFEVNGLEAGEVSLLLSKEELDNIMNNNGQAPARMNPMAIYGFVDKYTISSERANEILNHIFEQVETFGQMRDMLIEKQTLHENCYVADYINSKMIPQAREQGKDSDVQWFMQVCYAIEMAVWDRLFDGSVYTLVEKDTGEVYIRDNSVYVIYTDLYKYMGQFNYRKIYRSELLELIKEKDIKRVVVTDGPHWMTVVERAVFESELG